MVLSLVVTLVVSTSPAPQVVARSVATQAKTQKIEIIRSHTKKAAQSTETGAPVAKDNSAEQAAMKQQAEQLDAKTRQLEQREEELKAKEAALEEKKAREARAHAAQQKAAEEYGNQSNTEFGNAASALGGN